MARIRDLHFTAADVRPMLDVSPRLRDLADSVGNTTLARALADSMNALGTQYARRISHLIETKIVPNRELIHQITESTLNGSGDPADASLLQSAHAEIEGALQTILNPVSALGPPPAHTSRTGTPHPEGPAPPPTPDAPPPPPSPLRSPDARVTSHPHSDSDPDGPMPVDTFLADDTNAQRANADLADQLAPPPHLRSNNNPDLDEPTAPDSQSWLFELSNLYAADDSLMAGAFANTPAPQQTALLTAARLLRGRDQLPLLADAIYQPRSRPLLEAFFPQHHQRRQNPGNNQPPLSHRNDPVQNLLDHAANELGFTPDQVANLEKAVIGLRPRDEGASDIDSFDNVERLFDSLPPSEQRMILDMLTRLRTTSEQNGTPHHTTIRGWQWMFGLVRGDTDPNRPANPMQHWMDLMTAAGYTPQEITAISAPLSTLASAAQTRSSEIRTDFDNFLLDPQNLAIPGFVNSIQNAPATFRALAYQSPGQLRALYHQYRYGDSNDTTTPVTRNLTFAQWLSTRGYGKSLKGDRGEMIGNFALSRSGAVLLQQDKNVNEGGTDQVAFWPETGRLALVDNKAVLEPVRGASALQQNLAQNLHSVADEIATFAQELRQLSLQGGTENNPHLPQQLLDVAARLRRGAAAVDTALTQRQAIEQQAIDFETITLSSELSRSIEQSLSSASSPADRLAAFDAARAETFQHFDQGEMRNALDRIRAEIQAHPNANHNSLISTEVRTGVRAIFEPFATTWHGANAADRRNALEALRTAHPAPQITAFAEQIRIAMDRHVSSLLDDPSIRIDRLITNGFSSTNQLHDRALMSGLDIIDVYDVTPATE